MVNDNAIKMAYDLQAYLFAAGYDEKVNGKALETAKKLVAILEENAECKAAVS